MDQGLLSGLKKGQSVKLHTTLTKTKQAALKLSRRLSHGEPHHGVPEPEPTFFSSLYGAIVEDKVNILLLSVPAAFVCFFMELDPIWVFWTSFFAIIPLANLLGKSTEELGMRTNEQIAGLLNATFGNAVELIVSIIALKNDLFDVVKASLLGSIISNLLLVFGTACLVGGFKYKTLDFSDTSSCSPATLPSPLSSKQAAGTTSSLLMLTILAVMLPSVILHGRDAHTPEEVLRKQSLEISRYSSIVILLIYFAFLYYQLVSHKELFDAEAEDDEEEGPEVPSMPISAAVTLLAIVSVTVSFCGNFLVGAIEPVSTEWGMSQTFIGIILIPIVGNAAEHATAILMAAKNKMNLALAVVIGSSTQIAMSVIPALVIIAWIMGKPLGLDFGLELTTTLISSALLVFMIDNDGQTDWLEGVMLIGAYLIISICFFFHPV
eukprot:tig00000792_g4165.t1